MTKTISTATKQLDLFPEAPIKLSPRTIYLVGIDTDSADIDVIPFYDKYDALSYAHQQFAEYTKDYADYAEVREEGDLSVYAIKDGWLYTATDGDGIHIWVREVKIK
jgi:hypothetical protein